MRKHPALSRLRAVPGQKVLDLGCGPGDGASWLRRKDVDAIGLDYSDGMLQKARKDSLLLGRLTRGTISLLKEEVQLDGVIASALQVARPLEAQTSHDIGDPLRLRKTPGSRSTAG